MKFTYEIEAYVLIDFNIAVFLNKKTLIPDKQLAGFLLNLFKSNRKTITQIQFKQFSPENAKKKF